MEPNTKERAEVTKRPYEPPELTIHGNMEEITQFNDVGATDGQSGANISGPVI